MKSIANSHVESSTTGTLLPTDNQPKSSSNLLYFEAKVPADKPLIGGKPLAALVRKLETNSELVSHFAQARQTLGKLLEPGSDSLRALRLAAGMSQAKLAERAATTQAYVARIEIGRLDPGTDMLGRLADALGVPADKVFRAIRAQRERQHG